MSNRDETLVKVAIFYYEQGMTQNEIAKLLYISRPTVGAMLKEAREKGIVKITIQKKFYADSTLSKKQNTISRMYDLQNVFIAKTQNTEHETKSSIGDLCATFVEERLQKINALGIGWGTTVKSYVDAAQYLSYPNLSIIPLIGGVSVSETALHSNHLAFTLGQKYAADSSAFYAPVIAENIEIKEILYNSEIVQNILEEGRNVDLAIIGVGNPKESKTYRNMGYISNEEEKEIDAKNAIGDILTTFFNKNGKPVETSLSDRMIGPTIKDIKKMKEVVVLASGKSKVVSIQSLLKLNFINTLIIDEEIADQLLK